MRILINLNGFLCEWDCYMVPEVYTQQSRDFVSNFCLSRKYEIANKKSRF
jgi:hypothetical protein